MPQLVKNSELLEDNWTFLVDQELPAKVPDETFVSLNALGNAHSEQLPAKLGVCLTSDDDVMELEPYLKSLSKVAFRVENFMDGRNFSQARILREQLNFEGDIRAVGAFIQDQLHFLQRCGFNEFLFDNAVDLESVSQSLSDFSESYQSACDVPEPLFRRR